MPFASNNKNKTYTILIKKKEAPINID